MENLDEIKAGLIMRAQLILDNLRHSNSGADIHEVSNMRSAAQSIVTHAASLSLETMQDALKNLETKQLTYFTKKFLKFT